MPASDALVESPAETYAREGFCLRPQVLPRELIERVVPRMDAVIACEYETGVPPKSRLWKPGDDPRKIRKIDMPHLCDRTIHELISHPALGRAAAEITGAETIQVWAVQMLYKPPGGATAGGVGWHQDRQYWRYWEGEVFTAWIAVSDVTPEAGPIRFVPRSHEWGEVEGGDFFQGRLDELRGKIALPNGASWSEVEGVLPPGGVSFHHRYTFHGSGPNVSAGPRRSFAVHLRTEKSRPVAGAKDYFISNLDDPTANPVIYRA
ncbi:MAG: phytanoyl-CoA dioxygenase family protein [Planctomycetota bacterium]|nr:phytanoyl-CoA dioxygenase family protein [Planctomycetota bacterium]